MNTAFFFTLVLTIIMLNYYRHNKVTFHKDLLRDHKNRSVKPSALLIHQRSKKETDVNRPTLARGEIVFCVDENIFKIGDGGSVEEARNSNDDEKY